MKKLHSGILRLGRASQYDITSRGGELVQVVFVQELTLLALFAKRPQPMFTDKTRKEVV